MGAGKWQAVIVLPFVKFQYVTNLTVRERLPSLQPCAAALRPARLGVAAWQYLPWAPGEPCVAGRGCPGARSSGHQWSQATSDSDHTRARALSAAAAAVAASSPPLIPPWPMRCWPS